MTLEDEVKAIFGAPEMVAPYRFDARRGWFGVRGGGHCVVMLHGWTRRSVDMGADRRPTWSLEIQTVISPEPDIRSSSSLKRVIMTQGWFASEFGGVRGFVPLGEPMPSSMTFDSSGATVCYTTYRELMRKRVSHRDAADWTIRYVDGLIRSIEARYDRAHGGPAS